MAVQVVTPSPLAANVTASVAPNLDNCVAVAANGALVFQDANGNAVPTVFFTEAGGSFVATPFGAKAGTLITIVLAANSYCPFRVQSIDATNACVGFALT